MEQTVDFFRTAFLGVAAAAAIALGGQAAEISGAGTGDLGRLRGKDDCGSGDHPEESGSEEVHGLLHRRPKSRPY